MTRLRPTCTCCCVRSITFNAVTNGTNTHTHTRTHARTHIHTHTHTHAHTHTHTHTPQSVRRNDEYKILWDLNIQTDKVIEVRSPDIVCINKQNRASDYWLCYFWWPKHSRQGTGKNWQVPGLNNIITETLECQGSGHTSSYRYSRREQVMPKRIHQYIKQMDILADIMSIQKTAILGTAYILRRVLGI